MGRKHIRRGVFEGDRLQVYRRCAEKDFRAAEFRQLRAKFILSCISAVEAHEKIGSDNVPLDFDVQLAEEFLAAADEYAAYETIQNILVSGGLARNSYPTYISRLAARVSKGVTLFRSRLPRKHLRV